MKRNAETAHTENSYYVTTLSGAQMPRFIYGTAWKKENTTKLVIKALHKGFRGIDTACQPKHYREDLVGEAIQQFLKETGMKREDLFIQTKFTAISGQDPNNIPYDPKAPLAEQVKQSFEKSLQNLRTDYLDSLLLHSPLSSASDTMVVWRVFEELRNQRKVRVIGISNQYSFAGLKKLFNDATIKPEIIQNRFYKKSNYDPDIRAFCLKKGLWYQSFWTLTANPHILDTPYVLTLAKEKDKTPAQIFFRFVMKLGMVPLTGTSSEEHMQQDLEVGMLQFDLLPEEVQQISELLEIDE